MPPSKKKPNKVQHKQSKEAVQTLLALLSTSTKSEAAEKLGIARDTLYRRIEKYGINEQIAKIPEEAMSVLQQGSLEAAENFVKKVRSRNENISMEASKEILDRVGITKKDSNDGTFNAENMQINFSLANEHPTT